MKIYNGLKIEIIDSNKVDVIMTSDYGVFSKDDFNERSIGSSGIE